MLNIDDVTFIPIVPESSTNGTEKHIFNLLSARDTKPVNCKSIRSNGLNLVISMRISCIGSRTDGKLK